MVKKRVVTRGCAISLVLFLMVTGPTMILAGENGTSIAVENNENGASLAPASLAFYSSLSVPLYAQELDCWCWAASGRMCMKFLGKDVSQCSQASHYLSRTDCCNAQRCPNPNNGHPCNQGGRCEYSYWGFNSTMTYGALSWDALVNQIKNLKKPVDYQWYWTGGGAHIMVARGVQSDGSYNYVQINDPWAPCQGYTSWVNYTYWVSGGDHTSGWDIYNITKR